VVVVSPPRMGYRARTLLTRPPRVCASQLLDLRPHHPYRGGRGRWYHLWKSEQVLIGYLGAILSTMDATSLLLFSLAWFDGSPSSSNHRQLVRLPSSISLMDIQSRSTLPSNRSPLLHLERRLARSSRVSIRTSILFPSVFSPFSSRPSLLLFVWHIIIPVHPLCQLPTVLSLSVFARRPPPVNKPEACQSSGVHQSSLSRRIELMIWIAPR
jgi:hypothetical protein